MRPFRIEPVKRTGSSPFLRMMSALIVLAVFSLLVLPPGYAQDRVRHGTVVSCPPPEPAGMWIDYSLEFPRDSVAHAGGGRAIPFLINVNNSGRYFFSVLRTRTAGPGFQVALFDDVIRNFIQRTPRPANWNTVVPYTRSVKGFGGQVELKLPAYFSRASDAAVAENLVLLMVHPEDQVSPSSYKVWYYADQCYPRQGGQTPPQPTGCYWHEVTFLGQPTGWECLCDGKLADPKRCGPRPK